MAFTITRTVQEELEWVKSLREEDPETMAVVLANSQLLVTLAAQGKVRALLEMSKVEGLQKQTLSYYYIKMFQAACIHRHLDVMKLMVDNGFDVLHPFLRDTLHRVIELAESEDDAMQPIIRFLLHLNLDVNYQRRGDLLTPLHVACVKRFVGVASLLLLNGADANAVAQNDLMPLNCAESGHNESLSAIQADLQKNLANILLENKAQRTWRRPKVRSSDKMLSFSSCHNIYTPGQQFDTECGDEAI
ncbi:hypothetical protein THRCLA_21038 [Thraustotheca clavata]|uniref:Uncharacterized protein n=1 Tax=Thraustotheca clavata TaxID=74557 RepID=A0A1W0A0S9_9STRA|nr:hypothetical protein THRCLA_21038 [Thraustotheca clavata]